MGCLCGLGSRNQLAPFHNHPRFSKMSASWGRGGGETGKLLTHKMLGRGRCGPRLLDSYFGSALAGERPPSGRCERAPGQGRTRRGSGVGGEGRGPTSLQTSPREACCPLLSRATGRSLTSRGAFECVP